jgi:Flp pilus assembly pilin Flp
MRAQQVTLRRSAFLLHSKTTQEEHDMRIPGTSMNGRRELGQSTVEYVGLAVAVAVLLVAIGGGMGGHGDKLGGAVAKRLQEAIAATK